MLKAARRVHHIDVERVEAAIRAAEQATTGEVRVAISRFYFWGDVRRAAESTFSRLHMDQTRRRNGVLLFVAPRLRRFAVVGDTGIHRYVTTAFWNDVVDELGHAFRAGDPTGGLERAIAAIGVRLARHFPADPNDVNELSNRVLT